MRGLWIPALLLVALGAALGLTGAHAIGLEATLARRRARVRAEAEASELAASLPLRLARGEADEVARFRLGTAPPFDPVGATEAARLRFAHALHLSRLAPSVSDEPGAHSATDLAAAAFARLADDPDAGPLRAVAAAHRTALLLLGPDAAAAPPAPTSAEGTTESGLSLPLWCAYLELRRALSAGDPPPAVASAVTRLLDAPALLDLSPSQEGGGAPDGGDLLSLALYHLGPGLASLPPDLATALREREALTRLAHRALNRLRDAPMGVVGDLVAIREPDPPTSLRLVRPTGFVTARPDAIPADAVVAEAPPPLQGLVAWARLDPGPVAGRGPYLLLGAGLAVYLAAATAILVALARSRRAQALKDEFVATVSHELKTPIAGMSALAELLADPTPGAAADEPDRVRRYGERIHGEALRLAATVRNVLDIARVERDPTHAVRLAPGDPADAVRTTLALAAPAFARRGASLVAHVEAASAPLLVDPEALAHVLHNLLDNALKFSAARFITARSDDAGPNGAEVEVHAAPAPQTGGYRIEVLDRGPGVPLSERTRVFRRFARGRTAQTDAIPGVGLGLHVADLLVRAHGGTIEIGDREGGGARFVVLLPPPGATAPIAAPADAAAGARP